MTLGELARVCAVPRDRLDRWVRQGYLHASGGGAGPGRYKVFDELEVRIARRIARASQRLGLQPTARAFARARAALEKETDHGSNGHGADPGQHSQPARRRRS